jgi:hypothetical protein
VCALTISHGGIAIGIIVGFNMMAPGIGIREGSGEIKVDAKPDDGTTEIASSSSVISVRFRSRIIYRKHN